MSAQEPRAAVEIPPRLGRENAGREINVCEPARHSWQPVTGLVFESEWSDGGPWLHDLIIVKPRALAGLEVCAKCGHVRTRSVS